MLLCFMFHPCQIVVEHMMGRSQSFGDGRPAVQRRSKLGSATPRSRWGRGSLPHERSLPDGKPNPAIREQVLSRHRRESCAEVGNQLRPRATLTEMFTARNTYSNEASR